MNKHTKQNTISMNDVDFSGKTDVSHIMSIFQQAVTEHTALLDVDAPAVKRKLGAKWVITRARFEINECLHVGDSYTVETWPLEAKVLRFGRSFIIEKDGRRIASAYTEWCLLDIDTNEVIRAKNLVMPIETYLTDKVVSRPFSQKKEEMEKSDAVYTKTMRVSDLDINRHVNNISYIKMALDCFDTNELESTDIKSFEVYYLSQCYEKEEITMYRKDGCIEARRGDTPVFRCTVNA